MSSQKTVSVPPGVLMGVDWGGRRVGLALSDPTQTIARPLTILVREKDEGRNFEPEISLIGEIERVVRAYEVSAIVFGVPYYHLSGDENPRASFFMEAGKRIGFALSLPVHFSDEGHTSEEAAGILLSGKAGGRTRFSGKRILKDHLAAATLLQRFLDERCSHFRQGAPGEPIHSNPTERS